MGLLGYRPDTIDPDIIAPAMQKLTTDKTLSYPGFVALSYDPTRDLIFDYGPSLPAHPNGLVFQALNSAGDCVFEQTYYSTGGGWVSLPEELLREKKRPSFTRGATLTSTKRSLPFR